MKAKEIQVGEVYATSDPRYATTFVVVTGEVRKRRVRRSRGGYGYRDANLVPVRIIGERSHYIDSYHEGTGWPVSLQEGEGLVETRSLLMPKAQWEAEHAAIVASRKRQADAEKERARREKAIMTKHGVVLKAAGIHPYVGMRATLSLEGLAALIEAAQEVDSEPTCSLTQDYLEGDVCDLCGHTEGEHAEPTY